MKLLLDTHLLLWVAFDSEKLSLIARNLIENFENELIFSSASLWEIIIKSALNRNDFKVDARILRRGLLDNGYHELSINSEHTITTGDLPLLHKDPFDRILIAQSIIEGATLLTTDLMVAKYPGPIKQV